MSRKNEGSGEGFLYLGCFGLVLFSFCWFMLLLYLLKGRALWAQILGFFGALAIEVTCYGWLLDPEFVHAPWRTYCAMAWGTWVFCVVFGKVFMAKEELLST